MKTNKNIQKMVVMAILLAIVIILQSFSSFIKFGPFSITLVLLPITMGAILYGPRAGFLLGLIFGLVVLFSGDAAYFLGFNAVGTVITVLLKGSLAGAASGYAYKAFKNINKTVGTIVASITTPIVNTFIFALASLTILRPALKDMSGESNALTYLVLTVIGLNFVVEFLYCAILSPIVSRLTIYAFDTLQLNEE